MSTERMSTETALIYVPEDREKQIDNIYGHNAIYGIDDEEGNHLPGYCDLYEYLSEEEIVETVNRHREAIVDTSVLAFSEILLTGELKRMNITASKSKAT